jgi:hypothetical protein
LNIGKNLSPAPRADKRKSPARKKNIFLVAGAPRLCHSRELCETFRNNSRARKFFRDFFMRARAMQNAFHCEQPPCIVHGPIAQKISRHFFQKCNLLSPSVLPQFENPLARIAL